MKSSKTYLVQLGKLATLLLVVYSAAFYALPQQSKTKKALADVGVELLSEVEFERDFEPDTHHFSFTRTAENVTATKLAGIFYILNVKELSQKQQNKKFCLNCSFLFYG